MLPHVNNKQIQNRGRFLCCLAKRGNIIAVSQALTKMSIFILLEYPDRSCSFVRKDIIQPVAPFPEPVRSSIHQTTPSQLIFPHTPCQANPISPILPIPSNNLKSSAGAWQAHKLDIFHSAIHNSPPSEDVTSPQTYQSHHTTLSSHFPTNRTLHDLLIHSTPPRIISGATDR